MGYEYRATPSASGAISSSAFRDALESIPELELVDVSDRSVSFNLRDLQRDRTSWTEDGGASLEPDGSLSFVYHVAPPAVLIVRLERALRAAGLIADFEEQ